MQRSWLSNGPAAGALYDVGPFQLSVEGFWLLSKLSLVAKARGMRLVAWGAAAERVGSAARCVALARPACFWLKPLSTERVRAGAARSVSVHA